MVAHAGVFAVTAYRPSGVPLAWSGVPSEVPVERIAGPETYFLASRSARPSLDLHQAGSRSGEPASRRRRCRRAGRFVASRHPHADRRRGARHADGRAGNGATCTVRSVPHNSFVVEGPNQPAAGCRARERRAIEEARDDVAAPTSLPSCSAFSRSRSSSPFHRCCADASYWREGLLSTPQLRAAGLLVTLLAAARILLWYRANGEWTDQIFQTAALGDASQKPASNPARLSVYDGAAGSAGGPRLRLDRASAAQGATAPASARRRDTTGRSSPSLSSAPASWSRCCWSAMKCCSATRLPPRRSMPCTFRCIRSSWHDWPFAVGLILAQAVIFWTGILAVDGDVGGLADPARRRNRIGWILLCRRFPCSSSRSFPRAIGAAPSTVPALPTAFAGLACLAMAWAMAWARPRYRHASQALRLFAGALVLLIPAFVLYPSVHHFADRGLRRLIEEEYARQALDQRAELKKKLSTVLQEIDGAEHPESCAPAQATSERREPRAPPVVANRSQRPSGWRRLSSCTARMVR